MVHISHLLFLHISHTQQISNTLKQVFTLPHYNGMQHKGNIKMFSLWNGFQWKEDALQPGSNSFVFKLTFLQEVAS